MPFYNAQHTAKYVVFTAGRTGSQIICANLAQYHACARYDAKQQDISAGVVHSHYALWDPPDLQWIGVLSRRKNDFEAMCSYYIGDKTKEFVTYTNKSVQPFAVDYQDFERYFHHRQLFYCAVDHSKFAKTITVWYEELVSDPSHLFGQLSISKTTNLEVLSKSPYDYKKIIQNWEQMQQWYDTLARHTDYTQQDVNVWKDAARKNW